MPSFGTPISLRGPKGDVGNAGAAFLTTQGGAPTFAGTEGQGAVDTVNFVIYTYTNGSWQQSASFRGLQGVAGSNASFYFGQGAPTASNPAVPSGTNAIYLQANGEIWSWTAGASSWTDTGENWVGPPGPAGQRGSYRYVQPNPPPSDLTTLSPQPMKGDEFVDTSTTTGPYPPYVSYFS